MPEIDKIRILRIIARLNIGGPAIQAISLSDSLSKESYENMLVCGSVSTSEGDMSYLADSMGVEPHVISELGREISPFDDLKALISIREIVKSFKPHIIHTHTAKAGTLGRLAGIVSNALRTTPDRIKLVHTFHGHIFHSYFGFMKTLVFIQIERFLARYTNKIIAISPLQMRDVCEKYKITRSEKITVIPLGFDLSKFGQPGDQGIDIRTKFCPNSLENTLLVGSIGRLAPVKNHRMLIEAAKHLKEKGDGLHFRFLIVGDGELKKDLENEAHNLGVGQSVIFAGWEKDMPAAYAAVDIVILTSLNEGTPVSLIEAMASGKPIIATEVGGVPDLLGPVEHISGDGFKLAERGVLVPSEDSESLARALNFLKENSEVPARLAKRGREFALKRFTKERLVRDIESLYSNLVSG